MDKIIRTFHPIGQGAFYSERHPNYNIVYDCGSLTSGNRKEKVVHQSFSKNDTIDVLFISHFDADHVNLISKLKKTVQRIKYVVMPLIDTNKDCLAKLYNIIYPQYPTSLISNPTLFFGNKTKVIYVRSAEGDSIGEQRSIYTNDVLENETTISSGQPIRIDANNDWIFIPYNYKFQERTQDLILALTNKGIDYNRLQDDINYLVDNIAIIKEVFKSNNVSGTINENSMVLYSGPSQMNSSNYRLMRHMFPYFRRKCRYCDIEFHDVYHRLACVFTGDADLNKLNIKMVFGQLWKHVGTIQIPHHGSIENFNFSILDETPYICPVSFGTNNQFGHPSTKVTSSILADGSCLIQVTEELNSAYSQIIV